VRHHLTISTIVVPYEMMLKMYVFGSFFDFLGEKIY
jgi:hypothetical protein